MEALRLGVKSKLQLPAYTTTTAIPDLSCICNLYCSLHQSQILNPPNEARNWIMDTSYFGFLVFLFLFFCLFRAAFVACGSSQARCWIGATATLTAYTTATAMQDPSHICDLHHSSRQCRILNPLNKSSGIEPTSSWMVVRFVTTEPQWELP